MLKAGSLVSDHEQQNTQVVITDTNIIDIRSHFPLSKQPKAEPDCLKPIAYQ